MTVILMLNYIKNMLNLKYNINTLSILQYRNFYLFFIFFKKLNFLNFYGLYLNFIKTFTINSILGGIVFKKNYYGDHYNKFTNISINRLQPFSPLTYHLKTWKKENFYTMGSLYKENKFFFNQNYFFLKSSYDVTKNNIFNYYNFFFFNLYLNFFKSKKIKKFTNFKFLKKKLVNLNLINNYDFFNNKFNNLDGIDSVFNLLIYPNWKEYNFQKNDNFFRNLKPFKLLNKINDNIVLQKFYSNSNLDIFKNSQNDKYYYSDDILFYDLTNYSNQKIKKFDFFELSYYKKIKLNDYKLLKLNKLLKNNYKNKIRIKRLLKRLLKSKKRLKKLKNINKSKFIKKSKKGVFKKKYFLKKIKKLKIFKNIKKLKIFKNMKKSFKIKKIFLIRKGRLLFFIKFVNFFKYNLFFILKNNYKNKVRVNKLLKNKNPKPIKFNIIENYFLKTINFKKIFSILMKFYDKKEYNTLNIDKNLLNFFNNTLDNFFTMSNKNKHNIGKLNANALNKKYKFTINLLKYNDINISNNLKFNNNIIDMNSLDLIKNKYTYWFTFFSSWNWSFLFVNDFYNMEKKIDYHELRSNLFFHMVPFYNKTTTQYKLKNTFEDYRHFREWNFNKNYTDLLDKFYVKNLTNSERYSNNIYSKTSWFNTNNRFTKKLNWILIKNHYSKTLRFERKKVDSFFNLNYRYQYRLTNWLFYFKIYYGLKIFYENNCTIVNVLKNSKFVDGSENVHLIIKKHLCYINGYIVATEFLPIFTNDIISLKTNWYIFLYLMYNKKIYYYENLLIKSFMKNKFLKFKNDRPVSWDFIFQTEIYTDIPYYLEIDFTTLSCIMLTEPDFNYIIKKNIHKLIYAPLASIFNLNWKYIV